MPWKQKDMLSMKQEIIIKAISKQVKITDLAKEHNISRPTIYQWISDYKERGEESLLGQSTRPYTSPNRTEAELVKLILSARKRFHRSLKSELLKSHQFKSLEYTQDVFDDWRDVYNYQRPHEGINLLCPAQRYVASTRIYPEKLPEIEYLEGDELRKVLANGIIRYNGLSPYIGEHLRGQMVAIRPTSKDGVYGIYFIGNLITRVNLRSLRGEK